VRLGRRIGRGKQRPVQQRGQGGGADSRGRAAKELTAREKQFMLAVEIHRGSQNSG